MLNRARKTLFTIKNIKILAIWNENRTKIIEGIFQFKIAVSNDSTQSALLIASFYIYFLINLGFTDWGFGHWA